MFIQFKSYPMMTHCVFLMTKNDDIKYNENKLKKKHYLNMAHELFPTEYII